jgi:hypothetical protein
MFVEHESESELRFWVGACHCCSRSWWSVTFEKPKYDVEFDDWDVTLSNQLLRLASPAECLEHGLGPPAGSTVYCIVNEHGNGHDGSRYFIVADAVRVEHHVWQHGP